ILALLYRMTKNLYYPILVHILINITAFWDVWLLLFSGS
ncbi:CPBP family intramembrane metalloprotease, partial [Streptococcus pneumoniae]